jgi:hypothetical protein
MESALDSDAWGLEFPAGYGIIGRVKTSRGVAIVCRIWKRAGDGLLALLLFAGSLGLYVRTLAPSVATIFDDSLEFPLVIHRLGIAHPTGYPLYILLGKLFTIGAGSNAAWRVNLLSAVAGALTVALVFAVIRQVAHRRWAALLGAAALAVSPVFWSASVVAEVYTLNSAFVAALLLLALYWARQPFRPVVPFSLLLAPSGEKGQPSPESGEQPPADEKAGRGARPVALRLRGAWAGSMALYRRFLPAVPAKRRLLPHLRLYALAALLGLSLTHHRTVALLAPALLIFLLWVDWRALGRAALLGPERPGRPRFLQLAGRPAVLLALCFLLPQLLYLYLPIRGHVGSLDGSYVNTWSGFWSWVTGRGYSIFLGDNPLARELGGAFYFRLFWQQFGPIGIALALVGLAGLTRQPRALALTGLSFAAFVAFAILYRVPDVEVFFLPAFVIFAIWIGVGLDYAADLLRVRGPSLAVRRLLACCLLGLVLAGIVQPAVIAVRTYPDVDLSQRWAAHDWATYLLSQPLPANSTVVGLLGEMTLLRTFQEVAGLRPDIATVVQDDPAARLEAVESALAAGRAVHITGSLPGVTANHSLSAVVGSAEVAGNTETLVRVGDPQHEASSLPNPTHLEPVTGLQLLGYDVSERRDHWQDWVRLRLWWRAPAGLGRPLKVSARLVDSAGQPAGSRDAEPVAWTYPATAWRPGEVVSDAYEIPVAAGSPPGEYMPLAIVYDPDTGAELGRAELPPLSLGGSPARPPRQVLMERLGRLLRARFAQVELLGATSPERGAAFRPGEPLPLELLWQAVDEPPDDMRLALRLEGEGEYPLATEPVGGVYPTSRWIAGQVVRQPLALRVPGATPPGVYRLMLRVTRNGQPVPWGRGFLPLGSDLDLGTVSITR